MSVRNRKGLSLETKLPLLITGLLVTLVLTGSILAYIQMRKLSLEARGERLAAVSLQLAELVENSVRTRMEQLRVAAESPAVRAILLDPNADSAAARAVLDSLDASPEVLVRAVLQGPERSVALSVEGFPDDWTPAQVDSARAYRSVPAEGGYSELLAVAGTRVVWALVPVKEDDERLGEVAVLRTVSQSSSSAMRGLVGDGSAFYFANPLSGTWITLDGDVLPAPVSPPLSTPTFYRHADGSRRLGYGTILQTGGFVVVAEFPESVVYARANAFARQMAIASLLLILAGAIGAWLVSRGITAPVRALVQASEALARGDYTPRVVTERDDELGDLARTFSTMAREVESSHQRLSDGYREARKMAATIEAANRQLTEAVTEAKHSRQEAEAANRAKSEFVAMMSHELRTPISAIMGYAGLLEMEIPGELTAEQRTQIERIQVNCDQLVTLIGDVLDLARVESGTLAIGRGTGCMGAVIAQALAAVTPDAARKDILLLPPEQDTPDLSFAGDEERARQILINLLTNAIKFTDAGGKVQVSTCCHADSPGATSVEHEETAGWACICVQDTGIGIPAEDVERIFEPFVQADRNSSGSGIGLGLAISRRLAHLMGGDLTVTSEPGKGSTFTLKLPLAPVAAPAIPEAAQAAAARGSSTPSATAARDVPAETARLQEKAQPPASMNPAAKNPIQRLSAPVRAPRRPSRSPRAEPPSAHSG